MEFTNTEVHAIEAAIADKKAEEIRELQAMALLLVGGTTGDVHFG